jgi:parallel beta-helix repeat protein
MANERRARAATAVADLGMDALQKARHVLTAEDGWSVPEERGFTWWAHWLRHRVWASPPIRARDETGWQVRAQTPACRDVPDRPATFALLNAMNSVAALSALSFDAERRTISAACGAVLRSDSPPWLEDTLLVAVRLQVVDTWRAAPQLAEGGMLDEVPHPIAGRRPDPAAMLEAAHGLRPRPAPISMRVLERARQELGQAGLQALVREDLQVLLPLREGTLAVWQLGPAAHPALGPGISVRLMLPRALGPSRGAWLANALNVAEASEWSGEERPPALGAWMFKGVPTHVTFIPSASLGRLDAGRAMAAVRSLLAWGQQRAHFAAERLPWLAAAAAARYPDDVPIGDEADEDAHLELAQDADDGAAAPVAERPFGPASRTPRPPQERWDAQPELAAAREPRDLVVDPSDPEAYGEIDVAVADAEDGDRVLVRPGTYHVPVVVDRAVRIEGRGPAEDIVLEPARGEAMGIAASGSVVRGLTMRPSRVGDDGFPWSALAVHGAAVIVEGCRLSSHLGATVWVGGAAADLRLRDCVLRDGAQNAVTVADEARVQVVGCRISGHRGPLAAGGEHVSLVVRRSEIVDNLDHGIVAVGGATVVVDRCTISRNAGTGVLLGGAAPASRVVDSTIEDNAGGGVVVEGGRGRIRGNTIRGCDVGIAVTGGAAPRIDDNELVDNRLGIGVRGAGSDPRITGNTIRGCRAQGVIVDAAAGGEFDSNTVSASAGPGIWLDEDGTSPRFTGNHVSSSAVGVLVTNGAGGEFRSNDLRGNARGSWHLDAAGLLARSDNLEDAGIPGAELPGRGPGAAVAPPRRLN